MSISGLINYLQRRVKPEDTIEGKLRVIAENLAGIAEIKDTLQTPGWKRIREQIELTIDQCREDRYALDMNPRKNHDEIVSLRELERACIILLRSVESTLAAEDEQKKLKQSYMDALEAADLQRRHSVSGITMQPKMGT